MLVLVGGGDGGGGDGSISATTQRVRTSQNIEYPE